MTDIQNVPPPPSGTAIPMPPSGSIVATSSGEIPAPPSGSIVAVQQTPVANITPPPTVGATPLPVVSLDPNAGSISSYTPTNWDRLKAAVPALGHIVDKLTGNEPGNASMPLSDAGQLIYPERVYTPTEQEAHPIRTGFDEFAGSLTSPDNLLLMRGLGALGVIPGQAGKLIPKLASAGFGVQMVHDAIKTIPAAKAALDRGDTAEAERLGTHAVLSSLMGGLAGLHVVSGEGTVTTDPQEVSPASQPTAADDADEPNTQAATRGADNTAGAVTPGPGAQNLDTGADEGAVTLKQIGMSMRGGAKPSIADRINDAIGPDAIKEKVADAVSRTVDSATEGLDRIKAASSALWDAYKEPEQWTDFKDARGKWDYALQRSSNEAMQFAKDIKAGVPDELVREGMVNYIQAGGDDALLKQRADASTGDLAEGYEAARNLTSTQRIQAENISAWFNQKLQDAKDSGMLSAGVENYVNQIWDRPNPVTQKLQADIDYGTLRTNPSLLKQRVFDSYFDGEQAGFKPKNKDIGYLVTAYDEAFNKATAGRAFIKSMIDGKGKDGRPLLVANADRATAITTPEGDISANLIAPKFIGEKYADYGPVEHPALRKWTWIGKDSDGKPIFQNGDLWAHPEVKAELKNNLSNSWFRQNPVTRTVMDVGQKIKGSMLGYSLFHQVQEGVHAIGHKVNPFDVGKILDFDAPDQKTLIEHGLQVSNVHSQSEFMDGSNDAYAYRVPVIGRAAQRYSDYLFNDYIPNLKMKTALDILDRNRERYASKYTPDQIAEISAKQANAAYGELNYRQMGRNKTLQDAFRLVGLAPDFLEARGRFVAQALRPEGAEQRAALIRLTAILYGAARVTNMALNNGNPRLDKPFSVTFKGKDYFLRSIPGDIAHLVSDPRSFFYTRLNPTTTRPLIEELTGRDEFGRQRTTAQHFWDTLKGWSPIAVQKWIKNPQDFSPLDSVLTALGVASSRATPGDKALRHQFISGTLPMERLRKMQSNGDITKDQMQKIAAPVRKKRAQVAK